MSILLAMALAIAGPTKEEAKLLRPVKDSPTVQLDPNGAYILLRSGAPVPISLFRIATPEEVADYKARRSEALARAHAKWVKSHARWEADMKDWKKYPEGSRSPGEEPVEPTDASLSFTALDQENLIGFGPLNRFAKDKDNSTYLQRVWPGRYVIYGSVYINPNGGAMGMCVCMGTIAFDVKPGVITDVGAVKAVMLDALIAPGMVDKADPADQSKLRNGELTMMRWTLPNASLPLDPRLAGFKLVPASFHSAGPVPNYFGVQVDRMTAIPGVLGYDRDKIIDLTARPSESTN